MKTLLRKLKDDYRFDGDERREIIENMDNLEVDFEVGNYRFINSNDIDEIMQNELEGDTYILGCFNAWFLADILEIDQDIIEGFQKQEAYDSLGKLILSMDILEELQQEYASQDGYGHHFSHYDHSENIIILNNNQYYIFRIN